MNYLLRWVSFVAILLGTACTTSNRIFCVVPDSLPDGTSSQLQRVELEQWLVERAGGYTALGPVSGAWRAPSGEVIREQNNAYLISVDHNPRQFQRDLKIYIVDHFNQQEAYVERW